MQNRYAGDIGDFGKFGFLRSLLGSSEWRLGVVWYLFPDEKQTADGRFTQYLDKTHFKECDTDLHDKLARIVQGSRSVSALEQSGILSDNTLYYSECVDFYHKFPGQEKENKERRLVSRERWLKNAVERLKVCDAIFLDPDNGLEVVSCPKSYAKSGKYAYYSEVRELFQNKEICIIYHHLNRHGKHGPHHKQITDRVIDLRREIEPSGRIFAIRCRPYSPRAYFVLCTKESDGEIHRRIKIFIQTRWRMYWDNLYEESWS